MKTLQITQKYKLWFGISALIIIAGLVMMFTKGFNYGIDFVGGTEIQLTFKDKVEVSDIQETIKSFDLKAQIVHSGKEQKGISIKTAKSIDSETRIAIVDALENKYGKENVEFEAAEQFSANVGSELRNRALFAILIASLAMLVYIAIRFEPIFGISAVLALFHDVLILLAIYAIFGLTVNQSFIAAILTIVGYSINDTIVVFDRIRENVGREKGKSHFEVSNLSITQSLTRTINTSLTTVLVIGALYFLGVNSIKEFALPLMLGIVVGTYSSIFIASPLWALLKEKLKFRNAYHTK